MTRENIGVRMPPGPRGLSAFGFVNRTLPFLADTARRFGPISCFRLLHQRLYLVDEPDWIQDLLLSRQHEFARDAGATLLRELVGDGLLTRDEPAHRERRRTLQPAFHRAQIATYAETMVAECVRAANAWEPGSKLDIFGEMKRLTLNIVGACLFGADFSGTAGQIAAVLERVIRRSRLAAPGIALFEPVAKAYRRLFPDGRSLVFEAERRDFERILRPVIDQRRRAGNGDLFSLLLSDLSDQDATNEIVTMVLAGHETTAVALAWAWHLIGRHAQVENRIHEEIEAVLGRGDPTADDLPRLSYCAMVFNEVLRLYPPAPAFGRRPKHEVEIGGYRIPAGSSIILSPFVTQRSKRWFANPERFDPERWRESSVPRFAFFPFGGGAKVCIGEPFARMEAVLAIATVARRWRLCRADDGQPDIQAAMTLRPDRPVWMRPTPRLAPEARGGTNCGRALFGPVTHRRSLLK